MIDCIGTALRGSTYETGLRVKKKARRQSSGAISQGIVLRIRPCELQGHTGANEICLIIRLHQDRGVIHGIHGYAHGPGVAVLRAVVGFEGKTVRAIVIERWGVGDFIASNGAEGAVQRSLDNSEIERVVLDVRRCESD